MLNPLCKAATVDHGCGRDGVSWTLLAGTLPTGWFPDHERKSMAQNQRQPLMFRLLRKRLFLMIFLRDLGLR